MMHSGRWPDFLLLCGISSLSYRARWSFPFPILCNQHAATTSDVGAHETFPIPTSIILLCALAVCALTL
ncbi:Uncharacterised protein [Plesiomonas shigelloides]|nr:Uncharacterised protein [Plesiomonas shigelloides]